MAVTFPCILIIPPYLPEHHRHPQACQELSIHEEIEAGCFLTGHPEIQGPVGSAELGFSEERVYLFGAGGGPLGSVPYDSILAIALESHADVLKRFSAGRLMRLGHHALAFRAREASEACYVVVEWQSAAGHPHDGIFCLEGLAANTRAAQVVEAILHYADRHRQATGLHSHEDFDASLDDFERRRCGHCGKMHRAAAASAASGRRGAA